MKYDHQPFSQRQLKAGENLKKILARLFIQQTIVLPDIDLKLATVTEVRVSPDFKHARVYFMPLAGKDSEKFLKQLNEYALEIKKKGVKRMDSKIYAKFKFCIRRVV